MATNSGFWVTPTAPAALNWTPSLIEEIYQNVGNILGTIQGEVVLFRDFGLSADIIDQPMPVALRLLMADVVEKVHKYEPRVKVTRVQLANIGATATAAGTLAPKVYIKIKDEVLNNE